LTLKRQNCKWLCKSVWYDCSIFDKRCSNMTILTISKKPRFSQIQKHKSQKGLSA